jgi:hypothetical protein
MELEDKHLNPYPIDDLYYSNPPLTSEYSVALSENPSADTKPNSRRDLKWKVDSSFLGRDCASRQIQNMIGALGNPHVFLLERGGFAMWKNDQIRKQTKNLGMFERIELWDDDVIAEFPFEHYASLIGYFKVAIPVVKLAKVLSMSSNLSYDVPAKTLKIRGRDIYDLIALTTLVCLSLNDEVTLESIKEYKLVYKYIGTLQKESKYYKKNGLKSFVYKIWQSTQRI